MLPVSTHAYKQSEKSMISIKQKIMDYYKVNMISPFFFGGGEFVSWSFHLNYFHLFVYTDFLFSEIDNFSKHARLLQTELTHLDKDKLK